MINADLNAKIWLIKADVKMCLYGILVYVNWNAVNYVILMNTWIIQISYAKTDW